MDLPLPIRIALLPFSWVYEAIVRWKALGYANGRLPKKRLKGTVISVGNLTVGGTGKTPMVLWLAEKFLSEGKSVAILSRGYRGRQGSSDEVEVLRKRVGDRVRFGVGPNRFEEGRKLEATAPVDVFLLDDGFQHQQLVRDLDIVMLDGSRKLKDEWFLPAGKLREPVSACERADLLVVTRKFERPPIEAHFSHEFRIFYAQTRLLGFRRLGGEPGGAYLSEIGSGPFFGFCGVGNPQAFVDDLKRWHVAIAGTRAFRDHHAYSANDAQTLEAAALAAGAVGMVTTEKDEQNLGSAKFNKLPVYVAVIDFVISSKNEFTTAIDRVLAERRSRFA